jgi:hypothetical protein
MSHSLIPNQSLWDELLTQYVVEGQNVPKLETLLTHVSLINTRSLSGQMALLSTIPNNHWYYTLKEDGTKSSFNKVSYTQHLLFHPLQEHNSDSECRPKHPPTSPRNQIMFFILHDHYYYKLNTLIQHLLDVDTRKVDNFSCSDYGESEQQPSKKRKYSARVVKATPQKICQSLGLDVAEVTNIASQSRSMYTRFCEEIITTGLIKWCKHTEEEDVVILNDYNLSNGSGSLKPLSFVYVRHLNLTDCPYITCTCDMYKGLKAASMSDCSLGEEEETFLSADDMTCMHCRFYLQYLKGFFDLTGDQKTSHLFSKVDDGSLQNPVTVLGEPYPSSTTKLSVAGQKDEGHSFVHLTFHQTQGCFLAACQRGVCSINFRNRKKIPKKYTSTKTDPNACSHLKTLLANLEYLQPLFPGYFLPTSQTPPEVEANQEEDGENSENSDGECNDEEDDEDPPYIVQQIQEEINTLDAQVKNVECTVNFNTETGLWEPTAKSKHDPLDMEDPLLVKETLHRLSFIRQDNILPDGCYQGPDLVPPFTDENGQPLPCLCGGHYTAEKQNQSTTKIFTRNVSICNIKVHFKVSAG